MSLFYLFWLFAYIGLITIGGGLVAIPIMQQLLVGGGYIGSEQFFNMVAISESTPGPMGINMATYIGYELYGVPGGIITTAGTVLPSLICIIIIAKWFNKMAEKPLVKSAFYGLRPGVTGMIACAAWQVLNITVLSLPRFAQTGIWYDVVNVPSLIFYAAALVTAFKTKLHPILIVAAGAVFGVLFL